MKNYIKTYENIRKTEGDDYETDCLLYYLYFKKNYEMIATDLSDQHTLDGDPRAIQQISYTTNLDRPGNTTFFIIEEAKETQTFHKEL